MANSKHIQPTNIVTGMETVTDSFVWKIENLNKTVDIMGEVEPVTFDAWKDNAELTSHWKFSLSPKWEGIVNSRYNWNISAMRYSFAIRIEALQLPELLSIIPNAEIKFDAVVKGSSNNELNYSTGWKRLAVMKNEKITMAASSCFGQYLDVSPSESFTMTCTLQILRQKTRAEVISNGVSLLEEFHAAAKIKLQKDFLEYVERAYPSNLTKITSMDGIEFTAEKFPLAARSLVFEAMLKRNMSERKNGTVHIKDVGSGALKVLLHFIQKGELLPGWNEKEIIVDLTYAAHKYQIPDLLEFLNRSLGACCVLENAGQLIGLARKFSLATAEKDILKFIKRNLGNSFEELETFLKGVMQAAEGSDALVKV